MERYRRYSPTSYSTTEVGVVVEDKKSSRRREEDFAGWWFESSSIQNIKTHSLVIMMTMLCRTGMTQDNHENRDVHGSWRGDAKKSCKTHCVGTWTNLEVNRNSALLLAWRSQGWSLETLNEQVRKSRTALTVAVLAGAPRFSAIAAYSLLETKRLMLEHHLYKTLPPLYDATRLSVSGPFAQVPADHCECFVEFLLKSGCATVNRLMSRC